MKTTTLAALILVAGSCAAVAQTNQPADDWQPAPSNEPGQPYPQVNSEGRVRARIKAPDAHNVQLDISGVAFPMTRDKDGVWTGDSTPLDPGNHYYGLVIDGAHVPDPDGSFIYGSGAWRSDIEIPAPDQEFYALKNMPHGQVREIHYFGRTTNADRRSFVYTPPGYDQDSTRRYPVLYLLHGYSENETGWSHQGRAGLIMDNLIAAGKTTPFIIVMENGGAKTRRGGIAPGGPPRVNGRPVFDFSDFEHALLEDVIPYIDVHFRTFADQSHRALAGLSMGGMQTRTIALAHPDTFSQIGVFSGGSIAPKDIADVDAFKRQVKLVFISFGSRELDPAHRRGPFIGDPQADVAALKATGVNCVFYESPNTAHEWQTWRRSLYEFAPLLFQEQ